MTTRSNEAAQAYAMGILTLAEARSVLLDELYVNVEYSPTVDTADEGSPISARSLDGEDVEVVEFSQDGKWDDAALLREIATYAEESGRTPYAITYANDNDTRRFTAYLHA